MSDLQEFVVCAILSEDTKDEKHPVTLAVPMVTRATNCTGAIIETLKTLTKGSGNEKDYDKLIDLIREEYISMSDGMRAAQKRYRFYINMIYEATGYRFTIEHIDVCREASRGLLKLDRSAERGYV